jgi:putative endonuclease
LVFNYISIKKTKEFELALKLKNVEILILLTFTAMKAYLYILLCGNGQFYVGSTKNLERRMEEHQMGLGSNFTKKHLPVKLMYFEEYDSITLAFKREKQIQNWSHDKKEALINRDIALLKKLSKG